MRAINFEAMVAANRELVGKLPEAPKAYRTWNPERVAYDTDEANLDLFREMFVSPY